MTNTRLHGHGDVAGKANCRCDVAKFGLEIDVAERGGFAFKVPEHSLGVGEVQPVSPIGRRLAVRRGCEQAIFEAQLNASLAVGAWPVNRSEERGVGKEWVSTGRTEG